MTDGKSKVKVSLRLYQEDLNKLKIFFPSGGYNAAIRNLVSRLVKELEKKTNQKLSAIEMASGPEEVDLSNLEETEV